MPTTLLQSADLLDARGRRPGWVLIDGDRIAATGGAADAPPAADATLDLPGRTLTPGFVDLHCHGGGGASVDEGAAAIATALALHRAHGTTRSVLSLVAAPLDELEASLRTIAELARDDATVVGAHLEGPFLAPERRGAHAHEHLRTPDAATVERLIAAAEGHLVQVTIAPELPGALDAIARFVAAGVVVAVGHTSADAATARAAFDAGATLLTHACNAMPGIHHRAPGPIAAAVDDESVTLELILDGVHVDPAVARLLLRAAPGRVALVTDAMAAAGCGDGDYRLGSLEVTVTDGIARVVADRAIAGSTLTMDAALRLARASGIDETVAIAALTAVPAHVLGRGAEWGALEPGRAADVVVLDGEGCVERVWAAGRESEGVA